MPWHLLPVLVLAAVAGAIAATAVTGERSRDAPRGLLGELDREMHAYPSITPRLSISPDDPRCTAVVKSLLRCAPSSTMRSDRVASIAARASQAIRKGADPNALHTAALIDLLYESGVEKSLQRVVSSLQTAARLTVERPAPVLADLAAAYLIRAERAGTPRDLLAAIEAAQEAIEREPRNGAALYNLALALQRFGLVEEAAEAWREYLAADSASAWAGQARRHLREALALATPPPPPPAPDAPPSAYAAYAAAAPQGARELGWCRVLGAWAEAALARDTPRAEEHLRRAEALAGALEQRTGRDASLADGVRAIRARADGRGSHRLAEAHREFTAGCALAERVEFRAAAPRFASAAAAADRSRALRAWARLLYGGMLFRGGDPPAGEAILREILAEADPIRHPSLVAFARLSLVGRLQRTDRYEEVMEQAGQAARAFARTGERENEGAALTALSNARFFFRDQDEGYTLADRALERLRPYRGSYRLHNLLRFTAGIVAADGFKRAAVRMQDEGVRVAERTRNPVYVAEALLSRAQLLAAADALSRSGEDVAAAEPAMKKIGDPTVRGWMVAQRQIADAASSLRRRPARAAATLDSAAQFFHGLDIPLLALPAVVNGAQAHLAAGDMAHGMVRLEAALAILEQRRNSIRMEPRRAAVFETARGVVDRVAMLKLAMGDTAEALAYLDRGRASLAAVGSGEAAGADRTPTGPPDEVAVEFALVSDTLLAWTVAARRIELHRSVVDTARLVRTIESLRSRLEARAGEAAVRPALSQLYEWLIRPLEARLGAAETPLVVIADGDLASVPFAALYDARRDRYLVERHPLRFAASLREARRRSRGAAGAEALFVADPAFDPGQSPGFERLRAAAAEVREIVAGYPRARVLRDTAAKADAIRAGLVRAHLVHYAGHAVFDDERPERSYLLMAGAGRLEAGEIALLDLRHLSLVVLAACQTVRTGRGRAAGFSGLAGAFLAAGAGGAVGSLWEVDDRHTRRLMVEFHRAYRDSVDGPEALRAAQLRLLRAKDEALRSPSAWAGFRYAGH